RAGGLERAVDEIRVGEGLIGAIAPRARHVLPRREAGKLRPPAIAIRVTAHRDRARVARREVGGVLRERLLVEPDRLLEAMAVPTHVGLVAHRVHRVRTLPSEDAGPR